MKTTLSANKYLYNGKELQDEQLGSVNLDWYDYGARYYDPALGRFTGLDPIADQFAHVSPYNYAENEPVGSIDLWGLQRWKVNGRERTRPMSEGRTDRMTFGTSACFPSEAIKTGKFSWDKSNITSIVGRTAYYAADDGMNLTTGRGSERNALRHTMWSAKLTQEFGNDIAYSLTNAHEGIGLAHSSEIDFSQPFEGSVDLADHIVDLLNNEIGRDIGESLESGSLQDLASAVLDVFKADGLWVSEIGKDGSISISRQRISKDQYNRSLDIISNLSETGYSDEDDEERNK